MTAIVLIFTFGIGFWLLWSVSKKQKDDPLSDWSARRKEQITQLDPVRNMLKPPTRRYGNK